MHKIDIEIKPSKRFILFLLINLLCCIAIVATLPMPFALKFFLGILVLAYGGHALWRQGWLLSRRSIIRLSHDEDGWQWHDRQTSWRGELCGDSTLTAFLGILRLKAHGARVKQSCLIFKDTLSAESYRRLLVTARTAKNSLIKQP
jgi:hypothetical protein